MLNRIPTLGCLFLAAPLLAGNQIPKPSEEGIAPKLSSPATEMLSFEQERNERLTVPVTIQGAGPYRFMIDTGSQATAITHEINQALGLEDLGGALLVGMASSRPVQIVEVNDLQFGNQTIHNLVSPVLERRHVGADGILGLDTLQDFRVLIDFREESIALEDVSQQRASNRGFEIIVKAKQQDGQLLITNADIEGVDTVVIIDTGAQASIGNYALRDKIRARRAQQDVITTDVNGVAVKTTVSYARSLKIQGIDLKNIPITFTQAPAFKALGLQDRPVLSLGMEHLKLFDRVAIDFSTKRVLFDVPRDVAREMQRSKRNPFRSAIN